MRYAMTGYTDEELDRILFDAEVASDWGLFDAVEAEQIRRAEADHADACELVSE